MHVPTSDEASFSIMASRQSLSTRSRVYRSSSSDLTVTVNNKKVRSTKSFREWVAGNSVYIEGKRREEEGLLLFVYHALHDTGKSKWTADRDENNEPWGARVETNGGSFTYRGKPIVVKTTGESKNKHKAVPSTSGSKKKTIASSDKVAFTIKDFGQSVVEFRANSEPSNLRLAGYTFKNPVFYCPKARMVEEQEKAQPVLLAPLLAFEQDGSDPRVARTQHGGSRALC
jgi:hypothetical protein